MSSMWGEWRLILTKLCDAITHSNWGCAWHHSVYPWNAWVWVNAEYREVFWLVVWKNTTLYICWISKPENCCCSVLLHHIRWSDAVLQSKCIGSLQGGSVASKQKEVADENRTGSSKCSLALQIEWLGLLMLQYSNQFDHHLIFNKYIEIMFTLM